MHESPAAAIAVLVWVPATEPAEDLAAAQTRCLRFPFSPRRSGPGASVPRAASTVELSWSRAHVPQVVAFLELATRHSGNHEALRQLRRPSVAIAEESGGNLAEQFGDAGDLRILEVSGEDGFAVTAGIPAGDAQRGQVLKTGSRHRQGGDNAVHWSTATTTEWPNSKESGDYPNLGHCTDGRLCHHIGRGMPDTEHPDCDHDAFQRLPIQHRPFEHHTMSQLGANGPLALTWPERSQALGGGLLGGGVFPQLRGAVVASGDRQVNVVGRRVQSQGVCPVGEVCRPLRC